MTLVRVMATRSWLTRCLNAPFGARCFMTVFYVYVKQGEYLVLMHRLALGAL